MAKQGHERDQDDVRTAECIGRASDPMLELPQIGMDRQRIRETRLLAFYCHEDYHGIKRFLAKPATRG